MKSLLTLVALVVCVALIGALPAAAPAAGGGRPAHAAKKKCKKGHKKKCRKHHGPNRPPGPSPYAEGQPCNPADAKAYAKYGFLCLPQPQPDGTTKNELIPALA